MSGLDTILVRRDDIVGPESINELDIMVRRYCRNQRVPGLVEASYSTSPATASHSRSCAAHPPCSQCPTDDRHVTVGYLRTATGHVKRRARLISSKWYTRAVSLLLLLPRAGTFSRADRDTFVPWKNRGIVPDRFVFD
ncbi:hypothetical protein CFC21_019291 [Triticum aestivum]|uniref:Uncharacterized protein n=3 Tax=Triticum TaxID=4564 RepID=A0A9R1P5K8_TRITD|nr:hypothetical protein CFC21_019291 [Triticum aestivum]VAH37292.1 unnamed protein product [Triticum turgidum subsp. durum]